MGKKKHTLNPCPDCGRQPIPYYFAAYKHNVIYACKHCFEVEHKRPLCADHPQWSLRKARKVWNQATEDIQYDF